MAQLTPFDIVIMQTAFEEYAHKFPERPAPSIEEALAWHASRQKRPRRKLIPWTAVRETLHSFKENAREWLIRWKPISVR